MSNFECPICHAIHSEGPGGHYVTGCEHYPVEKKMEQLAKLNKRGCPTCCGIDPKTCMRCYGKTKMRDWYNTENGWEYLPNAQAANKIK